MWAGNIARWWRTSLAHVKPRAPLVRLSCLVSAVYLFLCGNLIFLFIELELLPSLEIFCLAWGVIYWQNVRVL